MAKTKTAPAATEAASQTPDEIRIELAAAVAAVLEGLKDGLRYGDGIRWLTVGELDDFARQGNAYALVRSDHPRYRDPDADLPGRVADAYRKAGGTLAAEDEDRLRREVNMLVNRPLDATSSARGYVRVRSTSAHILAAAETLGRERGSALSLARTVRSLVNAELADKLAEARS